MNKSMRKKMRHSKFKNTGILFEILTRQITADIISGNEESEARNLLFRYFKENTELGKEWRLYNFLLTEKIKDESHAERFLSVISKQREKLNNKKLTEEKYNLIKEMKDYYSVEDILKTNIKNYKTLASIYKLFEDISSSDIKFDAKEIYQAKTCIVENIMEKRQIVSESDELLKFYQKQNEDIRLLSYQILIDSLNKKYSSLDDDQKDILREYINSVTNTTKLGEFVVKKVGEIKSALNESLKNIKDSDVIRIKINEVIKQLDKVTPSKFIKDNHIMVLLLSYELLKEIKSNL